MAINCGSRQVTLEYGRSGGPLLTGPHADPQEKAAVGIKEFAYDIWGDAASPSIQRDDERQMQA